MKEIVVLSGKGGTGKTSLVASFASLARKLVLADADVDAPDLYLIFGEKDFKEEPFYGPLTYEIDPGLCQDCGRCAELCRFGAIAKLNGVYQIDQIKCEGCGVCFHFCAVGAVQRRKEPAGQVYTSQARTGPFVYARLRPGGENSGKLVTLVRQKARELAEKEGLDLILTDGAPGIACPVIASITQADHILLVTEPTVSGVHDFARVVDLVQHFKVPASVVVNKADLNQEKSQEIRGHAESVGLKFLGEIRYAPEFTQAQLQGRSVVEAFPDSEVAGQVRDVWQRLRGEI